PDDGAAIAQRHVHHLHDLLRERLAQRATKYGEILREDEHPAALDGAVPGDDAVAVGPVLHHVEVGAAVLDERVQLGEAAGVEEELDPLARQELAPSLLAFD